MGQVSILIVMLAIEPACCGWAQLPDPLEGSLRTVSTFDRLIMKEDVQADLQLSAEQILKAKEIVHAIRQSHRKEFDAALQDPASASNRRPTIAAILQSISRQSLARFEGPLRPEQITRLKQIELQERGVQALAAPEVEKSLHLTAEQKAKLAEIAREFDSAVHPTLGGAAKQKDSSAVLRHMLETRRRLMDKAVAILTPEQKKTWSTLAGPPFDFKIEKRGER
jgi:hypothetical protein